MISFRNLTRSPRTSPAGPSTSWYPTPTTRSAPWAPASFYEELIAYAKKYNIIVVHDNAYSDIIYDGVRGGSFLEFPGAKEVGIECFSLSKSFNLTGARVSFIIGNREIIDAVKLLRSQYDFGIFEPIQRLPSQLWRGPWNRSESSVPGIRNAGTPSVAAFAPSAGMCGTAGHHVCLGRIPGGFSSSQQFVMELMDKTGVICTPGDAFGSMGEGYVRFALVLPARKRFGK